MAPEFMLDRINQDEIMTKADARIRRHAEIGAKRAPISLPFSFKFGFSFGFYFYFSRCRGAVSSSA